MKKSYYVCVHVPGTNVFGNVSVSKKDFLALWDRFCYNSGSSYACNVQNYNDPSYPRLLSEYLIISGNDIHCIGYVMESE